MKPVCCPIERSSVLIKVTLQTGLIPTLNTKRIVMEDKLDGKEEIH
jgi:hypothetical protein